MERTSGVLVGCGRYFPLVTRLYLLLVLGTEATLPRHTCSAVESCDWVPASGKWVDVMCTAFRLGPYTLPFQRDVEIQGRITNPKGLLTPSEILQHWNHVGTCQKYRCSDLPPETYQIRAFSLTQFLRDLQTHKICEVLSWWTVRLLDGRKVCPWMTTQHGAFPLAGLRQWLHRANLGLSVLELGFSNLTEAEDIKKR